MSSIAVPVASLGAHVPSGTALLALVPLFALLAALIIYCLIDLIRAPSARYLPKPVWALIIVLVSAPLGALAYLIFGRDRHDHDRAEPEGADADRAGERITVGR